MTVDRGLTSAGAAEFERQGLGKGSVLTDKAFVSRSHSEAVAKMQKFFAEQSQTGIRMEISVKAGAALLAVSKKSGMPEEYERLMPRGQFFKVVSWNPKSRVWKVNAI